MPSNVFGTPVTDQTVQALPEYIGKKIGRKERAHVALNMKNAEGKDINARNYVENLKKQSGYGVSSLCLVYNAIGDTIRLVANEDWYCKWAVGGMATGSVAAVAYHGKSNAGNDCDWLLAWRNPWNRYLFTNTNLVVRVYTEIRKAHHYEPAGVWPILYDLLGNSGVYSSDTRNGCFSTISSGCFTCPTVEALLTLEDA
ncbi:23 kDa jasmonate-induced protein [Prunus yedoensis var. nudiflora]|uniref:23 kDa jasmonate-induced protein n=1 Tax=Prunus yedoensis var. nudiflora TaxID=2094558 RepID=A0A314YY03_PRUYE|nr:23 kDa jasmonate-induced protein [Prunus yedoensis var. nudiflora]